MIGVMTVLAVCSVAGYLIADRGNPVAAKWLCAVAALAYVALAVLFALSRDWPWSGIDTALAAFYGWLWWNRRNRRRRRRSLRSLGEKSRARLAAMARNMPKPGPVLRPVPQGARYEG